MLLVCFILLLFHIICFLLFETHVCFENRFEPTPAQVASSCDVTFAMLADPDSAVKYILGYRIISPEWNSEIIDIVLLIRQTEYENYNSSNLNAIWYLVIHRRC